MNIFTQLFKKSADPQKRKQEIVTELMRREAEIGKNIFGPIPKGGDRSFFCLDKNTWVWNEEWQENGTQHKKNTTYSVRENGIVKSINGGAYQSISLKEAQNLQAASKLYVERVGEKIYGRQTTVQ